jgi:hypothetical protein
MDQCIEKLVEELRLCFAAKLNLISAVYKGSLTGRLEETKVVGVSVRSTGGAICELSRKPDYFFAEMTMLSRSFLEKIVNLCYLLVCDDDDYKGFFLHPYYKTYHNFDKKKTAGQETVFLKFSGKDQLRNHPKIIEALQHFSADNSRLNWSKKSVDEKVVIIRDRSKIKVAFFLINTLMIYSNASEALHGTLLGCTFHIGLFEPGMDYRNIDSVKAKVFKETALLFAQLSSITAETLKLISSIQPIGDELEKIEHLEKRSIEVMMDIFKPTSAQEVGTEPKA